MKCKKNFKDINKYRVYREKQKRKYYGSRDFSIEEKRPWTEEEVRIVMEHKLTDTETAKMIMRSVKAIQVKRSRMKELEA